jgi:hypothetical protein
MAANFGTTSPSVGDHWYDASSVVGIGATVPSMIYGERYVWLNWTGSGSGSYSGTVKTPSVIINGPITEEAFWEHQYQVSFAVSPSRAGTTTPSGTNMWKDAGALSISATPKSGYTFSSWSTEGSITVDDPSSSSAMATISGSGTITANFAPVYSVTFTESGLPSGTSWTVTFNGVTESSTSKSITFTVQAGSYSWNVSTPISGAAGTWYVASPSSGTINVPSSTSQRIKYKTQHKVTFAQSAVGSDFTGTMVIIEGKRARLTSRKQLQSSVFASCGIFS